MTAEFEGQDVGYGSERLRQQWAYRDNGAAIRARRPLGAPNSLPEDGFAEEPGLAATDE